MSQPPRSANPIPELLDALVDGLRDDRRGAVSTYIPELAGADQDWCGLALCTLDGHVYASGDSDQEFTLQSLSKPFVYALALSDRGLDDVITHLGVEPSGEAFNAIRLEPGTGRPPNPMVNAGAILTTSLVNGASPEDRFERIRAGLSAFAGRDLGVDEAVYASERATGDRNRALAYLMRNAGALKGDAEESVSTYFRQCSVTADVRDVAVMSGTLANGGVNPVTGDRVVGAETAAHVLTIMASCGMYDFSGEWLLRVGIPAKSGVSGGLVAALPAQFGIGVFSPLLDERGNSVRGIGACEELSARFGLSLIHPVVPTVSAVFEAGSVRTMRSATARSGEEEAALRREGDAVAVRRLQGDVGFAGAELLTREVGDNGDIRWLVLDLTHVSQIHTIALRLLDRMTDFLTALSVVTLAVDQHQRGLLSNAETEFPTLDEALQWCENRLLASASDQRDA